MTDTETAASPSIRYAKSNGVATLTISQPAKLNAMTFQMWSGLATGVRRAEEDPEIRVILLRGDGIRAFCAGADISQFGAMRDGADAVAAYEEAVTAGTAALANASKPTVAAVSGICFGGGFGLSMCCDLRVASSDSRYRIPAARLGLGYAFDGVELISKKIGINHTADLLMSARIIDASEASAMGVVNTVFEAVTFEMDVLAYVERISANAPLTLRAVKAALIEILKPAAARNLTNVDALVSACFDSSDYREGREAFAQKRNPVFKGY